MKPASCTAKIAQLLMSAVLFVALAAGSVRADSKSDYDTLIRSALQEYDAGRYDEAGALFKRAHDLSPNARTYRGLGLTYYEARKYALAVSHLRAALDDKRRPLTAAQREGTQKILRQAEGFVAHIRVVLDPAQSTLEVDGYPAELKDGELLLDGGAHELIARAPEYVEERRRIEAIAGSSTELQITLTSQQAAAGAQNQNTEAPREAAAPVAETTPAPAASTSRGPGVGPYIVMGVGGAALIGAVVTGIMAKSLHSDLEKRCDKNGCTGEDPEADKKKGHTLVVATNVLWISGLVVAGAGAAWWFLAPRSETAPQVAAGCAPGGCMASVSGRF